MRGNGYEKQLGFTPLRENAFIYVSVPLRGNGYEKRFMQAALLARKENQFPSPCGEMVMKNITSSRITVKVPSDVSVPLRGNGYEKQRDGDFFPIMSA